MIDEIIPIHVFQNVIFKYCSGDEQIILKRLYYNDKLEIINLYYISLFTLNRLSDAMLKRCRKVRKLKTNRDISDDGIKHLKLYFLHAHNGITNRGIRKMKRLCKLYLHINCKINDEGLKHLNLYSLHTNDNISDDSIKHMNLHFLHICKNNNQITDKGIKHMTNLRILEVGNNIITDEGIKHLKSQYLSINTNNKNITNEGIKHMDLKTIFSLGYYTITKEDIKHMTNCKLYQ